MRITVDKDDPAFNPDFDYTKAMVFLNGEYLEHCVTADDELGMVLCYAYDGPSGIEYEWFDGDVRIVILKEESEDEVNSVCKCTDGVATTDATVCKNCGGSIS